jgi:hypothetical protein
MLLEMLESADLSNEHDYKEICGVVDIQNFIDHHIAVFYFSNKDYANNNVKLWKPRDSDGKWRQLFFDCDACMSMINYDPVSEYTNDSEYLPIRQDWMIYVFARLLENQEFRDEFYTRSCNLLNSTFHPDTVIQMIEQYKSLYRPLMQEHIYRWNIPNSMHKWEYNTSILNRFALQRPPRFLMQMIKNFGNPIVIYPNPSDGNFYVKSLMEGSNVLNISITSVSGGCLYSENISFSGGTDIPVSVNLPGGVYLLSLRNEHMIFTEKLFIRR